MVLLPPLFLPSSTMSCIRTWIGRASVATHCLRRLPRASRAASGSRAMSEKNKLSSPTAVVPGKDLQARLMLRGWRSMESAQTGAPSRCLSLRSLIACICLTKWSLSSHSHSFLHGWAWCLATSRGSVTVFCIFCYFLFFEF